MLENVKIDQWSVRHNLSNKLKVELHIIIFLKFRDLLDTSLKVKGPII